MINNKIEKNVRQFIRCSQAAKTSSSEYRTENGVQPNNIADKERKGQSESKVIK